ncbi:hypothetical protein SAMN05421666_2365 [Roseovarius nanhaiticus]|uniref:Uncharacterized protein n=1 Tax=Roseovarius nanhaiticus TaxID=573024 RepID=A0A1N7H1K6_9RHOB|nr:hypothetical protein [Roseovarius nanhaiticus]SEL16308.1 hypothetical protein SAMN05216208_2954 [Roseovarius nanhaiticus]SIS18737.1 hypothetical protein SAMN05421666_2365 [Roseovarius nanhaiticus]
MPPSSHASRPGQTPKPAQDRTPRPSPAPAQGLSGPERAALVLSAAWLVLTAVVFAVFGMAGTDGALGFLVIALVIFLPVAMIWVAATAARTARVMREESARLHAAIDAIRQAYITQSQTLAAPANSQVSVARKLDEIAAAQRKTETALATFSSIRPMANPAPVRRAPAPAPAAPSDEAQTALPLGTQAEDMRPPLERSDFIRALNFPETAEDKEGFAALRRALKDRPTAQLIQAAQDVLTLLSQDGIYMDDLRPDMARPETWRNFAGGARGRAIAALGGIRDRSSLALAAARMKNDPIFRDAAHHFLRRFDQMFSSFADDATDSDISDLSDTRTARAFMLLGRVAGTFD